VYSVNLSKLFTVVDKYSFLPGISYTNYKLLEDAYCTWLFPFPRYVPKWDVWK